MSKEKTIQPELFEVKHEYAKTYIVAYDMIHALQSMPNHASDDLSIEIKQLTGVGNFLNGLKVAKECLPQGLVNKTVDDNESKT